MARKISSMLIISLIALSWSAALAPVVSAAQNDMGTGGDAGNTTGTATLISPDSGTGYLDNTDIDDYYKVNVSSGQTISVSMTPPTGANFDLDIWDPSQTIVAGSYEFAGYTDTAEFTSTSSGDHYVRVYVQEGSGTYSMTVTITENTLPENVQYTLTTYVYPSGAGSVTLSPAGGVYDEGTIVTLTATPSTGYEFSYWSEGALGSSVTTTVTMNSNKSATANFTTTGENQVSTSLSVSPSSFTLQSGSSTTLTATLTDSGGNTLANKNIAWSTTAGSFSATTTTTDSSGQASVTYTAPTVTAGTKVTVTASFASDNEYGASKAGSSGTITVENVVTSIAFSPPHLDEGSDTDGDGYYDYLVIKTSLRVNTAGTYNLSASLYDGAGNYIAYASEAPYLNTGSQAVSLKFDGSSIYQWKANGPYTVYIYLYDSSWSWIGDNTHTTSTYSYTDFQHTVTAVSLSPPHSDRGLDNDGDGVYDYLVIDVRVNIGKAGKYYVGGSLYSGTTTYTYENYTYSSYGTSVAWAWEEITLSTGAQTVSLYFDGKDIKRSKVDGPYTASISIYDDTYTSYDWGEHTTSTYTYTQFGRGAAEFSSPHSDSGSDKDGDGLYDYLKITVKINVATAGKYGISGSLSSGSSDNYYTTTTYSGQGYGGYTYIDYAWSDVNLTTGAQTATISFNGSKIRQSKVNGPYTVYISLYDSSGNWIDSDTHTSKTYSYTEFQTAAVTLVPPHSDEGSDTDGDGYYNKLVVDVNLNVATAGTYSVGGSLMSGGSGSSYTSYKENAGYGTASDTTTYYDTSYSDYDNSYLSGTHIDYAWKETELSTGKQTVKLSFDGMRIRQAGLDGPYTVELCVYGPHKEEYGTYSCDWTTSDYGTHTTGSYTYTQFQQSTASFSPPHSDEGSDTNGDGLHDYLVVSASVKVTTSGKYHVSASLMSGESGGESGSYYGTYKQGGDYGTASDNTASYGPSGTSYGTYIDYAWTDVELSAGTHKVKLNFSGSKIRSSGKNGPYYVNLSLNDSNWNWLGYDTHKTETYSYTDFQTLPIEFSTPHIDRGANTDDDNLYEYLDVDVKVNVITAGTYLITGTITSSYSLAVSSASSPGAAPSASAPDTSTKQQTTATSSTSATYSPIIAMKRATLGAGTQTVKLRFPGGLIYQSKQNGPYYIWLAIVENFGTWSMLDYDSYKTTTAYSYTDFEPPMATLAPPHTDYGSDTDGDGYYNKLVVDVKLNVRTAGGLKVLGVLMDSDGDFVDRTIKDITLEAGQQSVKLEFRGWKIYSSHVEGSMEVGILLLDPNVGEQVWYDIGGIKIPLAGWVGMGEHTTATYSYDKFQSTTPAYTAMVVNQPVGQLSAGQATTVNFGDKCPTLGNVRVAARENAAAPTVSVTEETEVPEGVPEPTENVITYITITVDNAEGQSFTLQVSKARLKDLNIDAKSVKVFRFEDNWVEVSVEKTGEDENYIYFEVTTSGFSVFAVTGAQLPTQPFVEIPPIWVIVITAVVLVTALLAVIWRYLSIGGRKIEGRFEKPSPRRKF